MISSSPPRTRPPADSSIAKVPPFRFTITNDMSTRLHNTITDIPGIRVGHAQNEEALTGCTVILCEAGATGGVDQRGGAPGTRETDALHPMHLVEHVHAVVLSGGSAFGLDAASGAVRYLEERGVGFDVRVRSEEHT